MRELIKSTVNALARPLRVRVVGSEWGPRGFASSFERAKSDGFIPATVIDVGASDGRWTTECLRIFPRAKYALFDPLPENLPALSNLAAREPSVRFWSGAIGGGSARLPLNLHGHQTSFYSSTDFAGGPLEVEVRTLDSFIESMNLQAPMLLKADVQGYELEVLRGATRCLQMTELLLLEVSFRQIYSGSPLAHQVIAECGRLGYRIYDICTYSQRPRDGALAQADVIFVKRDSSLFSSEGWA